MSQHTLLIRCPTWEHLENLYTKKIKPGNVLVARVPFCPGKGSTIHITIELPDQSRKVLESTVEGVRPAPDARKSSLKLKVHGLTSAVRTSFEKKVAAQRKQQDADAPRTMPRQKPGTSLEPPAPIPADVPIREPVFTPGVPSTISSTAGAVCQEQFRLLKKERARLRELAAHDVLGVSRDTDVIGIRQAYFAMTKRFHPDRLARYECAEVSALASELFIHINQAYDRLRQGAIAAGKAILAGPALLPHEGWIASFSDIGTLNRDLHLAMTICESRPSPTDRLTVL